MGVCFCSVERSGGVPCWTGSFSGRRNSIVRSAFSKVCLPSIYYNPYECHGSDWQLVHRKQFSHADFSKTLRDLGLTPSAVRAPFVFDIYISIVDSWACCRFSSLHKPVTSRCNNGAIEATERETVNEKD